MSRCRFYNTLPVDGGMLEQNEGLLNYMETCYRAYVLGQTRLTKMDGDDRKFVVWLMGGPDV